MQVISTFFPWLSPEKGFWKTHCVGLETYGRKKRFFIIPNQHAHTEEMVKAQKAAQQYFLNSIDEIESMFTQKEPAAILNFCRNALHIHLHEQEAAAQPLKKGRTQAKKSITHS